ncbi:MAG: hypothetical protein A2402_02860 [Candidatus Staskawiczbacteria bacterium RIFOXYC1_FULL_37_43]|nr:MAG: hypothetical protein A2813_03365 [Candidatus Staskawiczbacteria bacterium RIFCSPHIGHO2_01_FULL_37_17]OGZ71538.1 MAG: hypothetical protein A2891_02445 [Candidatus Staskawiczbacteria bacterium RIFCSPLOWO2_01_FULL_37_19]OGZ76294.1 MAG: hypothetical protein A2205_00810 [Candidatus Staskawiczbacteria bacterium RIFOXYA1_FULL_37_15]OGZ76981.1 MAG: hypothetical protein A2280_01545 [Candidatus Staskawiczbacteria bacterium RIFOXYA12_FULL_37_10]OGZ80309.1 MAG: hypothetical protein A2353_03520 [Can
MALQLDNFLLLLGVAAVFLVLFLINLFLVWYFYKTNKNIDKLLEKGKIKDLKDVLLSHAEKNKKLEDSIEKIFGDVENLRKLSEKSVQNIGVVRFNPFSDMGGNQSFAIALLDNKNNGFVISSLFIKEGNRVYAKAVKDGKSDYLLSNEEKEAIVRAMGSRNLKS